MNNSYGTLRYYQSRYFETCWATSIMFHPVKYSSLSLDYFREYPRNPTAFESPRMSMKVNPLYHVAENGTQSIHVHELPENTLTKFP